MKRATFAVLVFLPLAGCGAMRISPADRIVAYDSTFSRVLARAERGDAESQNAAGFMLYRGEGIAPDRVQARGWFERAAARGNARALRNLAALAVPRDDESAGSKSRSLAPAGRGETHYMRFCGGCHGVNGVAAYENSPSFAFGEGLERSDTRLMRSVLDGMQEMPGWGGKLAEPDLHEILAFVRTLPGRYDDGVAADLRPPPAYRYLFGRMERRRFGEEPSGRPVSGPRPRKG